METTSSLIKVSLEEGVVSPPEALQSMLL
uniref:Uncharacterized protein n=1 Tax=Anguilla anguilla TaxID=7936 RepID=A0A0E9UTI4_ANGAN